MSVLAGKTKGQFASIARRHARAASRRPQAGTVLFHAFPSGLPQSRPSFYGFRQHVSGSGAECSYKNPPGLTRYPGFGENWALKLSTPDRAKGEMAQSHYEFATYKNLSRFVPVSDSPIITYSGYFAAFPAREAPGANWGLGIDYQTWGSTDRSFFKVYAVYPNGTGAAQWNLINNAGEQVAIPANASKRHTAGINQNKANFNYVELGIKLNANGSGSETRGQYYSLQINDLFFDLTNTAIWPDPTQTGQTAAQGSTSDPTTSAAHLLNYDGGLNFGVLGSAPTVEGSHPFRLICSDLMATLYDSES